MNKHVGIITFIPEPSGRRWIAYGVGDNDHRMGHVASLFLAGWEGWTASRVYGFRDGTAETLEQERFLTEQAALNWAAEWLTEDWTRLKEAYPRFFSKEAVSYFSNCKDCRFVSYKGFIIRIAYRLYETQPVCYASPRHNLNASAYYVGTWAEVKAEIDAPFMKLSSGIVPLPKE